MNKQREIENLKRSSLQKYIRKNIAKQIYALFALIRIVTNLHGINIKEQGLTTK